MTKEQWEERLRTLGLPSHDLLFPYHLTDEQKELFIQKVLSGRQSPRSPTTNERFARSGPLADYTGTVGREALRATIPAIGKSDELLGRLKDERVLAGLASRREDAPLPVTSTNRQFYDSSLKRGSLFPGPRPSLESRTTPTDRSFIDINKRRDPLFPGSRPSLESRTTPTERSFYDVESRRDPIFPGPRPSLESRTTPTNRQFYDIDKRRDPLFPGPRPSLESRRLPLTIEVDEPGRILGDPGLTSFSDRLKALDIQGINAVLPYPTMSPGVTRNRKKLQRQRDTFRALMDLNPVDIVWSDNLSTSQMEDRWTRRRKQYMSKLLQLTRPQSRSEVNAVASAAGLDTDEWKEMLEVFDASRQDLTYKKGQIEISELVEKGFIREAAREFITGVNLDILQNPEKFALELHDFQSAYPLASGKEFSEEIEAQLKLVYQKPDKAQPLTLTDSDGLSHLGYVQYDYKGLPTYYLSQGNEKIPDMTGWTMSSPTASIIDVDMGIAPTKAQQLNLATGALRNVNYALSEFIDTSGNMKIGIWDRLMMDKNMPGTKGRYIRQIMANAVGDALRLESGAAIPPEELMQMMERYMPAPGDTPQMQKYKIREFWERAVGLVRLALPNHPIASPVWAPALVETEEAALKLPPGSYFQTKKMRDKSLMGRTPGGEIGF